MHKLLYVSVASATLFFATMPSNAIAQSLGGPDRGGGVSSLTTRLPAGIIARYRVTYFSSQTNNVALRSASVISVTNQSPSNCTISVDWKIGLGGIACTTSLAVGPGSQVDFCTRALPSGATACNSTCSPGLAFTEGNATVGSSTITGCDNIAVSARTIYTQTTSDAPISAITDAKVVRWGAANNGD